MPQTIKMVDILERSKPFIEQGKLGIQAGKGMCYYEYDDGCRCIVGTALDRETLDSIKASDQNHVTINTVTHVDMKPSDVEDIRSLQGAHDRACCSGLESDTKTFFSVLDNMKKKYEVAE